jgi:hypothetical protein
LLLGGIAGGLLGVRLQSDEPVLGVQSGKQFAPATTEAGTSAGPSTDIEALRAQRYAPAPLVDIDGVRAQRYAPTKVGFIDIEALRAQGYEAPAPAPVDIEALRAERYVPAPPLDIEALRAQRYAAGN